MKINKGLITGIVLGVLGTAGVYATLNIDTTISNLYSYVKKLILTDDGTANGIQKIVLDGTNGSISMSGALNIKEGALKDNTIVSNDIKDGEVKKDDIANGAVDSAKVKDNSLTASDLAANSVGASELANNAVDTTAIQNNAITSEKIATGAVTENKLSSNLRAKIGNTLSKKDIEKMGFKEFVTTCNSNTIGKRRRSDLKKCIRESAYTRILKYTGKDYYNWAGGKYTKHLRDFCLLKCNRLPGNNVSVLVKYDKTDENYPREYDHRVQCDKRGWCRYRGNHRWYSNVYLGCKCTKSLYYLWK